MVHSQKSTPTPTMPPTDAFHDGSQHFSGGIGFPNIYKSLLINAFNTSVNDYKLKNGVQGGESFSYTASGLGPLFAKYEYGVLEHIGVGIVFGYFDAKITGTHNWQEQNLSNGLTTRYYESHTTIVKSYSIGGRFNYHFGNKQRIDPYLGFAAGMSKTTVKYTVDSNSSKVLKSSDIQTTPIPLYFSTTFGLRVYMNPRFGFYTEIGFDKWSVIQGGLVYKLD